MSETSEALSEVPSVEKTATYTWKLRAYRHNTNLAIAFETNAPFEAGGKSRAGHIKVFDGDFPADPAQGGYIHLDVDKSPWITNRQWSEGWNIAWVAEAMTQNGSGDEYGVSKGWVYLLRMTT